MLDIFGSKQCFCPHVRVYFVKCATHRVFLKSPSDLIIINISLTCVEAAAYANPTGAEDSCNHERNATEEKEVEGFHVVIIIIGYRR